MQKLLTMQKFFQIWSHCLWVAHDDELLLSTEAEKLNWKIVFPERDYKLFGTKNASTLSSEKWRNSFSRTIRSSKGARQKSKRINAIFSSKEVAVTHHWEECFKTYHLLLLQKENIWHNFLHLRKYAVTDIYV